MSSNTGKTGEEHRATLNENDMHYCDYDKYDAYEEDFELRHTGASGSGGGGGNGGKQKGSSMYSSKHVRAIESRNKSPKKTTGKGPKSKKKP
mmetsp:Transcript_38506/g.89523  ORF Transcript_38506/g.89523 Transcript_38506/m.89523 type:complete len:92 (-) Transcript_38506:669-944(-)